MQQVPDHDGALHVLSRMLTDQWAAPSGHNPDFRPLLLLFVPHVSVRVRALTACVHACTLLTWHAVTIRSKTPAECKLAGRERHTLELLVARHDSSFFLHPPTHAPTWKASSACCSSPSLLTEGEVASISSRPAAATRHCMERERSQSLLGQDT